LSEYILKVGGKGEIYTTKKLRALVNIKENGRVKAIVKGNKLIIEAIPTLEDMLQKNIIELSPEDIEKLSIEVQKEEGIYG